MSSGTRWVRYCRRWVLENSTGDLEFLELGVDFKTFLMSVGFGETLVSLPHSPAGRWLEPGWPGTCCWEKKGCESLFERRPVSLVFEFKNIIKWPSKSSLLARHKCSAVAEWEPLLLTFFILANVQTQQLCVADRITICGCKWLIKQRRSRAVTHFKRYILYSSIVVSVLGCLPQFFFFPLDFVMWQTQGQPLNVLFKLQSFLFIWPDAGNQQMGPFDDKNTTRRSWKFTRKAPTGPGRHTCITW